jgi:hypothetical protein
MPVQFDLGTPGDGFPSSGSSSRTSILYTPPKSSLVKSILAPILSLLPRIGGGRKRNDEGIIAPRTPLRGSPLPSPRLAPQGYSPWGVSEGANTGSLTPSGSHPSLGVGLTASTSFQNSLSNRAMLSPLKMNAPPPRRTASEISMSGQTGSQVSPSNGNASPFAGSSHSLTGQGDSSGPSKFTSRARSVSPGPMMNGSNPSLGGLTARRAARKDD